VRGFLLNPVLPEQEVLAFAQRYQIELPADYRYFLTTVGNGGAGPFYGIFPLGQADGLGHSLESWAEADEFVGKRSEPFTLTNSWNDLDGRPPTELFDLNEKKYGKDLDLFDANYFDPQQ